MGVVPAVDRRNVELEELWREILRIAELSRRRKWREEDGGERRAELEREELVCVTSGTSFVGFAVVRRLLSRGYLVRIAVESEEDLEKLREMGLDGSCDERISVVVTKMTDLESLSEAFNGCSGVFHTSAFVDPAGLSGYTKHMADLECSAAEMVLEACTRTVRKCIFTSSLLACIWQQSDPEVFRHRALDESCWSDESLCRDKKLWGALGKTKAERAAWRVARDSNLKLATICPALVTGSQFSRRNPTASVAYLKGAGEMYRNKVLATVDVEHVAEAHVRLYEGLGKGAQGRYICYDRVIEGEGEAAELAREVGTPTPFEAEISRDSAACFDLSNSKLSRLMSRPSSRCNGST